MTDIHRGQSTSLVVRGSEVEVQKLGSLIKAKGAFSVQFRVLRRILSPDMLRSDSTYSMLAAEEQNIGKQFRSEEVRVFGFRLSVDDISMDMWTVVSRHG